jgi:hypothetical protein
MVNTNYTFLELIQDVSDYRGCGRNPTGDNLIVARKRANDAYRRFLIYHNWSFMRGDITLTTEYAKWRYPLPDDFASFISKLYYGKNYTYPALIEKTFGEILSLRTGSGETTGYPRYYALKPADFFPIEGQRWELVLYPTPSAAYPLTFIYKKLVNTLVDDTDIPIGGPECATLIRAVCLGEVELMDKKKVGEWYQQGAIELAKAVVRDAGRSPSSVGVNISQGDGREISLYSGGGVYLNGVRIDR